MRQKKSISLLYACLMALLFMAPQFMKPLHFAFAHRHENHAHDAKGAALSSLEKECAYCDFHFFHFVGGMLLYNPAEIVIHLFSKATAPIISTLSVTGVNKACAGRAPPGHLTLNTAQL